MEQINDCNTANMVENICRKAKIAARKLAVTGSEVKKQALLHMADALEANADKIISANALDMAKAKENNLSVPMQERLMLDAKRVSAMASGLRTVASQCDPVSRVLSTVERPNGIRIDKVSVPVGVIGIIYESRPNVTCDAAGICIFAGNSCVLRGGSEAFNSNMAIADILNSAGADAGLPENAVQLIPTSERSAVGVLLKMDRYVDLLIPRGGEGLIRFVVENATIPVIKHYKGVCHVYVASSADFEMAANIILNAKCQRPGVCNALESLLLDRSIAEKFISYLLPRLEERNVRLYGDAEAAALAPGRIIPMKSDKDYETEYLDYAMSLKVVDGVENAVEHINSYGSHHSDCIISGDAAEAEYFLANVDSAAVYHNASTRFTDGGEFGMGAEIGISTDKLHARGPMGADELTIFKFIVRGSGQIR